MDRKQTPRTDNRNDMMVIFGPLYFEEGNDPQAFLGKGVAGMPGMCVRPAHDSKIKIGPGYQVVSMAIRPEWPNIYARAILDRTYIQDILNDLKRQLDMYADSQPLDIPAPPNSVRITPILSFEWSIRGGVPTPNSSWGRGLRNNQGQMNNGLPVFSHKDDPIPSKGFWLVEIDVHPTNGYFFARPSRNYRLVDMAMRQIQHQLDQIDKLIADNMFPGTNQAAGA